MTWYQDCLNALVKLIYGYYNLLKYLIMRLTQFPNDIVFVCAMAIALYGVYKILSLYSRKKKSRIIDLGDMKINKKTTILSKHMGFSQKAKTDRHS